MEYTLNLSFKARSFAHSMQADPAHSGYPTLASTHFRITLGITLSPVITGARGERVGHCLSSPSIFLLEKQLQVLYTGLVEDFLLVQVV
ncbi:MAG: hypothetical protein KGI83_01365, partial [Verrucomicrobiota bacterium]|nr:hypothetical protein [Verrucomicrobiota bacterium]